MSTKQGLIHYAAYNKLVALRAQPDALKKRPAPRAACIEHQWSYTNYGRSCTACGIYEDV